MRASGTYRLSSRSTCRATRAVCSVLVPTGSSIRTATVPESGFGR